MVIESAGRNGYGVLNADDPIVAEMQEDCPGQVIFFGLDSSGTVMSSHLASGGMAAYLCNGELVLAKGSEETVLMRAADIPATYGGTIVFQVQNALAGAAACWGPNTHGQIGDGSRVDRGTPVMVVGLAGPANSIATGCGLWVLITIFGLISGAHFNPAVTLAFATAGEFDWRDVVPYVLTQVVAAFAGVAAAHMMFELPLFTASEHARAGPFLNWHRLAGDRGFVDR